eukprot:365482-Chlamydomonas_euryale.AAC.1
MQHTPAIRRRGTRAIACILCSAFTTDLRAYPLHDRRHGEDAITYAERVFCRAFTTDIERVAGMADLWKSRPPPTPLRLGELLGSCEDARRAEMDAALSGTHAGAGLRASACKALRLADPNRKCVNATAKLQVSLSFFHKPPP